MHALDQEETAEVIMKNIRCSLRTIADDQSPTLHHTDADQRYRSVTSIPPLPSSLALIATITVLADINTAPTAGVRSRPQ